MSGGPAAGFANLKSHPWFRDFDWAALAARTLPPPRKFKTDHTDDWDVESCCDDDDGRPSNAVELPSARAQNASCCPSHSPAASAPPDPRACSAAAGASGNEQQQHEMQRERSESCKAKEAEEQAALEQKKKHERTLAAIVQSLTERDTNRWFSDPIDTSVVTDYREVVKQPMDLARMAQKVQAEQYTSVADLHADFHLIIANCKDYNRIGVTEGAEVFVDAAEALEKFGDALFEAVTEPQCDMWAQLQAFLAVRPKRERAPPKQFLAGPASGRVADPQAEAAAAASARTADPAQRRTQPTPREKPPRKRPQRLSTGKAGQASGAYPKRQRRQSTWPGMVDSGSRCDTTPGLAGRCWCLLTQALRAAGSHSPSREADCRCTARSPTRCGSTDK